MKPIKCKIDPEIDHVELYRGITGLQLVHQRKTGTGHKTASVVLTESTAKRLRAAITRWLNGGEP